MKKISIVVPVYNAEKYIIRTLNSILDQSYKNIEIIVVNDGSTDRSEELCRDASCANSKIQYFKIPNGGPSNARNFGISKATGEYIGFCDSDDVIHCNMYETLVSALEQSNADIALCDIYSERDKQNFGFPWNDGTVFEESQIQNVLMAAMIGNRSDNDQAVPVWGSVVRCLFKKSIIEESKVRFPTDIYFAEDLVFTLNYLLYSKRAVICSQPFYHYTCNEDSLMNSFFSYKQDMFTTRKRLVAYITKAIEGLPEYRQLRERLTVTERCYYHECVGNACRPSDGRTSSNMKKELREICEDADVKRAFRSFDAADKRKKLIYFMIQKKMTEILYLYYARRFR